jgi:hypothetical protein
MKLFDWENRLSMDTCAIANRDQDNVSIIKYNTTNFKTEIDDNTMNALISANPNLKYKNGYGVSTGTTIDKDSQSRIIPPTHGPEKKQLFTRNFISVPDFARGSLNGVGFESILKYNVDDTTLCRNALREANIDRFIPLVDSMKQYMFGCRQTTSLPYGMDTREQWRCLSRSNK